MPLVSRDADQIADLFVHDIEQGIQGTDIKAAFLKCAADEPGVTENVEKVHRAVARASLRTGVPIMAHSRPASDTAPRQIEIFAEEGVDLDKVQIAHCGDSPDADYIESIIEKGVWAGPRPLRHRDVPAVRASGSRRTSPCSSAATPTASSSRPTPARRSTGSRRRRSSSWPGAALIKDWTIKIVHDRVLPALREGGMTEEQEHTMLHENPVRWLTGESLS